MSAKLSAEMPLGLYVHLPWCVRKCPYCDFNSHELRGDLPERGYLDALLADIGFAAEGIAGRSFSTVFFGGGTPSLFSPCSIEAVLDELERQNLLEADAEITLEANPGTVDEAHFSGFRAAGVNRLSLGVQSFNDAYLSALGRIHSGEAARRAAAAAVRVFDNVNLDLMYGLPGQTCATASSDVDTAIDIGPQHLSCYELTIEPNTVFYKRPPELPQDDERAAIEASVDQRLAAAGYEHYEVSAHARPGRQCRHNLNYWSFGDYLGIGAGAHSKRTFAETAGTQALGVIRETRLRVPGAYMRAAGTDGVLAKRSRLTPVDLLPEFTMNALRLRGGFSLDLFTSRTGLDAAALSPGLQEAAARGLLEVGNDHVRPTTLGRRFLNEAIGGFL